MQCKSKSSVQFWAFCLLHWSLAAAEPSLARGSEESASGRRDFSSSTTHEVMDIIGCNIRAFYWLDHATSLVAGASTKSFRCLSNLHLASLVLEVSNSIANCDVCSPLFVGLHLVEFFLGWEFLGIFSCMLWNIYIHLCKMVEVKVYNKDLTVVSNCMWMDGWCKIRLSIQAVTQLWSESCSTCQTSRDFLF
jgi:hypothetical protein